MAVDIAHPVADAGDRTERGAAVRKKVPRRSFGHWEPAPDRADPVALLSSQEKNRLPDLIPERRRRMLESPFSFFRGAAIIQAADVGAMPNTGLVVQCCGDAHLSNFGGFQAPDRNMVFDINDFDETSHGPFEWDVMRLAASFEIAGRASGLTEAEREAVVAGTVQYYREAMAHFASMGNLELWYSRLDATEARDRWRAAIDKETLKRFRKNVEKAKGKDSLRALSKMTELYGDQHRLVSDPPRLVPVRDLPNANAVWASLDERFRGYVQRLEPARRTLLDRYHLVDAARNTVGVGSVGLRGWVLLLMGRDDNDPLFLQLKEAGQSVLEPYGGRSRFTSHGRRVVEGQRLLQASGDILLGWTRAPGSDGVERDHYVRQLWDGKMSANIEGMAVSTFGVYGQMCGWTLARGHARSGDRIAIAGYMGSGDVFDQSMAAYARRYADLNDLDHARAQDAWGPIAGA
jgi:uncharacterized protein (DUF2252 family)